MPSARRLSAIMFTDTVGSTAAAQANEKRALELRAEQVEIVRPLFESHEGREIKSIGDGFLVEFDSALRAVQCAVEIQQRLHERNARPGADPILLRIGIHLGDVEQVENDILGDAVNIASRIEPLSPPGGVCISGEVASQVRNKIPNRLQVLPPTPLKGVSAPIEIFRLELPLMSAGPMSPNAGLAGIAVLPFTNISPDPNDEYFAEGLTEELITVLSKVSGLRVIARTSVSPYKSTPKGISQVGAELRVSSILEGSVRKAGSRLRITAQLIDVATEGHLWAETYDRNLDDIFAVQADVARRVAESLRVSVPRATAGSSSARPTVTSDSYLAYLRGRTVLHHPTPEDSGKRQYDRAIEQFTQAIALDAANAAAYAGLSEATHARGLLIGEDPWEVWGRSARDLAARSIELDPNCAEGHGALAIVLHDENQYPAAEREFLTALSINPNDASVRLNYADCLLEQARAEDAGRELTLAEELDPLSLPIVLKSFFLLIATRKLDAAYTKIDRLQKIGIPPFFYHLLLNLHCWAKSDAQGQLEQLDLSLKAEPASPWNDLLRAWTFAGAGQAVRARELLPLGSVLPEVADRFRYETETYARLGDLDALFAVINRAIEIHEFDPIMLRLDPKYEHVRRDPRFQVSLARVNLA